MVNKIFIEAYLEQISKKYNLEQTYKIPKNRALDKAFEIFSIAAVLEKPFDEVYDEILIKSGDGGIDGAYLEENEDSFLLYVFQCKNVQNLGQKDLRCFKQSVSDFRNGNIDKPNTKGLKRIFEEYKSASKKKYGSIKEHFIFNGYIEDDKTINKQIFDSENSPKNNFYIYDIVKIDTLIANSIGSTKRKLVKFQFSAIESNLTEQYPQSLVSYIVKNVKAANFRMRVIDLCELYKLEEKTNGSSDSLFSENVRGFLGYGNKTNEKIKSTLKSPRWSEYFPFFNNGITIICSEMELPLDHNVRNHFIPVKNPVIVNGFQTTRVIYDVYKESPELLKGVYVTVKLFQTSDRFVISKITQATNTQSTINFKDKISNKTFQKYAKEFFSEKDIAYIEKRGSIFSHKFLKETHEHSTSSDKILKFWYASFYEQPDVAKSSKSKVLEAIFDATNGDHELKVLFDGSRDSPVYYQLYVVYKILDQVTKKRKSGDDRKFDFIDHSDEILVYGIYKNIIERSKCFSNQNISDAYDSVVNVVHKIVQEEKKIREKRKAEYSHNTYFKGSKCKIDYNTKKGYVENDNLCDQLLKLDISD